jgi:peptidoglycan hydrolase CwlO-like protein
MKSKCLSPGVEGQGEKAMIKKALIGTAAALLVGGFVFGRDVFSYVRTAGVSVRDAVRSEVPLEFEVERAREMVERLVPEIRDSMHVIAEQQVDIEHMNRDINRKTAELTRQKGAILTLKGDLEKGGSTFQYASRTYSSTDVKRDLAQRFVRFKAAEETLKRDRDILEAREKALRAHEQKLDGMLAAKKDLEVQVEQLSARLKTLQAAQTVSTLEIDDSELTRVKKLIAELNKQLDVKEKMLDARRRRQVRGIDSGRPAGGRSADRECHRGNQCLLQGRCQEGRAVAGDGERRIAGPLNGAAFGTRHIPRAAGP